MEYFSKLRQAGPVGISTAMLLVCAVAGCTALVFRSLVKRGLPVVTVLLFLFVLTPVVETIMFALTSGTHRGRPPLLRQKPY